MTSTVIQRKCTTGFSYWRARGCYQYIINALWRPDYARLFGPNPADCLLIHVTVPTDLFRVTIYRGFGSGSTHGYETDRLVRARTGCGPWRSQTRAEGVWRVRPSTSNRRAALLARLLATRCRLTTHTGSAGWQFPPKAQTRSPTRRFRRASWRGTPRRGWTRCCGIELWRDVLCMGIWCP